MALNKLPSNASLKEAVTQTENINTEISTLKGKLKTNLVNKGVTATDSDKMSILIDKIPSIETGLKLGIGSNLTDLYYQDQSLRVLCGIEFKDVNYMYVPGNGSIGVSVVHNSDSTGAKGSKVKFELYSPNGTLKDEKTSAFNMSTTGVLFDVQFDNVKSGDKILVKVAIGISGSYYVNISKFRMYASIL